jgi:hypothetical protein
LAGPFPPLLPHGPPAHFICMRPRFFACRLSSSSVHPNQLQPSILNAPFSSSHNQTTTTTSQLRLDKNSLLCLPFAYVSPRSSIHVPSPDILKPPSLSRTTEMPVSVQHSPPPLHQPGEVTKRPKGERASAVPLLSVFGPFFLGIGNRPRFKN